VRGQHGADEFPDSLRAVGEWLRDQRPTLEPLELDRVKLRAMSRARGSVSAGPRAFARSRLASLFTIAFLVIGTGGALALCGTKSFGNAGGGGGSASYGQYRTCGPHGYKQCPKPPPPTCNSGWKLNGNTCIKIPPPPHCNTGWELSGNACVKTPPSSPPVIKLPPPLCIKTVIIGKKTVLYGQKGCGVIHLP